MEKILLTNPDILPEENVLEFALGESYPAYVSLLSAITGNETGLVPQWNYYKDGKACLCKVQYKKKTVFWLSVWDSYFKTAFYFTEKHLADFKELPVNPALKEQLSLAKPFGKLIPLALTISDTSQLDDLKVIVDFKKTLI